MTLMEQCQIWNENDEYAKIIEAIEALPDEAYGNGEFSSIRVIYHAPLALDTRAVIRVSEIDGGYLCSIRSRDTLHTLIELKNK